MKILITIFLHFVILIQCSAQTQVEVNEVENLKKSAFCQCFYRAISLDSLATWNDVSATYYLQNGKLDIQDYLSIYSFSDEYVEENKKNYVSLYDENLNLMMCLDLLYSQKLDSMVITLIRNK